MPQAVCEGGTKIPAQAARKARGCGAAERDVTPTDAYRIWLGSHHHPIQDETCPGHSSRQWRLEYQIRRHNLTKGREVGTIATRVLIDSYCV